MLLPGGSKLLAAGENDDTMCATLVLQVWMGGWACRLAHVLWFRGSLPAFKASCRMQGTAGVVCWCATVCSEGLMVLKGSLWLQERVRPDQACMTADAGNVRLLAALHGHC